jgi:hypothetical protein
MKSRVEKAYKSITAFLQQPHFRDEFLDKHLAIALYSNPLSLYIFVSNIYFKADIKQNRKLLWEEEGYRCENGK